MTATIVANRGTITISGSADNFEQAQRAERIARGAAGGHPVVGMISTTSG
jgi:osmotically-inducible protein OsmY